MEKNSLIHYHYEPKSKDTFVFTTDSNIEYAVYFEDEIQNYFQNIYPEKAKKFLEFGFIPVSIKISEVNQYPFDKRIILTVVQILKEYFEYNQNAIIYNCLASDGKQGVRARYFDSIFRKVRQNEILKFNSVIDSANDIQFYQSLLIRNDNPELEELVEAFYSIASILGA